MFTLYSLLYLAARYYRCHFFSNFKLIVNTRVKLECECYGETTVACILYVVGNIKITDT